MVSKKGNQTGGGAGGGTPPGPDSDQVAILKAMLADFQQRDAERQSEMERLGGVLQQLTQVNSIECILANGFEELSNKLAPLEDLAPKREELRPGPRACLENLKDALARPDWSGALSLPVRSNPVPYFGTTFLLEGSIAS